MRQPSRADPPGRGLLALRAFVGGSKSGHPPKVPGDRDSVANYRFNDILAALKFRNSCSGKKSLIAFKYSSHGPATFKPDGPGAPVSGWPGPLPVGSLSRVVRLCYRGQRDWVDGSFRVYNLGRRLAPLGGCASSCHCRCAFLRHQPRLYSDTWSVTPPIRSLFGLAGAPARLVLPGAGTAGSGAPYLWHITAATW